MSQARLLLSNKKHPRLYRERIAAGPPTHFLWVAGSAATVWLWMSGRFALRRLRGTSHRPRHLAEMIVASAAIPFLSVGWRLRGAVKYRVAFL